MFAIEGVLVAIAIYYMIAWHLTKKNNDIRQVINVKPDKVHRFSWLFPVVIFVWIATGTAYGVPKYHAPAFLLIALFTYYILNGGIFIIDRGLIIICGNLFFAPLVEWKDIQSFIVVGQTEKVLVIKFNKKTPLYDVVRVVIDEETVPLATKYLGSYLQGEEIKAKVEPK